VINECKNNTPRIQFSTSRQIPSVYDDSDVSFNTSPAACTKNTV